MILTRIELTDFRSYRGTQVFDLGQCANADGRNIVAIGGLNGTGKTSLLDATAFALLGVVDAFKFVEDIERKGDGKQKIDRTLDGIFNREAREAGQREAKVRLSFVDDAGQQFSVQRTWVYDHRGRFRDEQAVVRVGGRDLTSEHYGDFLKNQIPPEVVKFFAFDGEKIQAIAQDEIGESVIEGVNSLLGFHVLDTLVTDMDKLQEEYRQESQRRNRQEEELGDLRSQAMKLANQIRELKEDQGRFEESVDRFREQSRALAEELNELLGGQGSNPRDIQRQMETASEQIRDLKDQIVNMVERWVIPAIPAETLANLATQLAGEERRAQWEEGRRKVEPQRNLLIHRVLGEKSDQPSPALTSGQVQFLQDRIRHEWDNLFNPPPAGIAENVIHGSLSDEERAQARAKCTQVLDSAGADLDTLLSQLDSAERRALMLRQQLERVGDGERVNELLEKKGQIDRELGEAQNAWDATKRKAQALTTDLRDVRQKISKKEDELVESGESSQRGNFVRKVKKTIKQYQDALRPRKRDEVAEYLTEMYQRLARKEDVVDRIELDEKTYRPRLLDRRGNLIPLHTLSAGEREIYALSLLWALGRTSRRHLPVIIDTPLARLDSHHRANIVKRYLPVAGPQVIVLSTDTEIDREYFELVQDHLAVSLRLEFDRTTERTTVHEGYFQFD
jgi:DNA sulfur modification protein DndD